MRHWAVPLLMATLALFLLSLSWRATPVDVDPINLRLALYEYNISEDKPHPAGYPLYVFAGRFASVLIGSEYALQLVTGLAWSVTGLFLFGWLKNQLSVQAGLVSQIAWYCNPLMIAATVSPETYVAESLYCAAIGFFCSSLKHNSRFLCIGIVFCMAIMGLTRPTAVLYLLPFLALSLRLVSKMRWISVFITIMIGLSAWYTLQSAFVHYFVGSVEYKQSVERVMVSSLRGYSVLAGADWRSHLAGAIKLLAWSTLVAMPILVGSCLTGRQTARAFREHDSKQLAIQVLSAFFGPVIFFALIYYLKPTYLAAPVVACCVLVGLFWHVLTPSWKGKAPAILSVMALGVVFLPVAWLPPQLGRLTLQHLHRVHLAFEEVDLKCTRLRASGQTPLLLFRNSTTLTPYHGRLVTDAIVVAQQGNGSYVVYSPPFWKPASMAVEERIRAMDGVVLVEH